jgi:hypothetical protein
VKRLEEVMGSRPKRFDVAGMHSDEVCGALGELTRTVEEIGRQVGLERITRVWGQNRPVRSADSFDADAQHFLASGVQFIDGCAKDLAPGLSKEQRQIRDRCNDLAGSMERVLVKRLEEQPAKTWSFVKVNVSPWVKEGQATLSMEKAVQAVKDMLRSHFDGSAWKAGMAQRDHDAWAMNADVHAEETVMSLPMSDGARSWEAFRDRVDVERLRSAEKGQHWPDINIDEDIDFSQVMNFRTTFRQRARQRM